MARTGPHPAPTTATLHGRVFYNDRREHGLFGERFEPDGDPGTRCDPDGERDDGTACSVNWLGGRYIVVDVIERDEGFLPTDFNCKREDVVASVAVGRDGGFAATFPVGDDCRNDSRSEMAVELRMRLRFCGTDYCFSMNDRKNRPYALSSSVASASSPLTVRRGDNLTMPDMFFNTSASLGPERLLDRGELLCVGRRHYPVAARRQRGAVLQRGLTGRCSTSSRRRGARRRRRRGRTRW